MTAKPISSLPLATTADGTDVVVLVIGGVYHRIALADFIDGLPTVTTSARGIMSAADKTNLSSLLTQVSQVVAPVSTPIASAASIAIPAGSYHITLSGTTTITEVTGMVPRLVYTISYPAGAGLTFMGELMKAGDVLSYIDA